MGADGFLGITRASRSKPAMNEMMRQWPNEQSVATHDDFVVGHHGDLLAGRPRPIADSGDGKRNRRDQFDRDRVQFTISLEPFGSMSN